MPLTKSWGVELIERRAEGSEYRYNNPQNTGTNYERVPSETDKKRERQRRVSVRKFVADTERD